MSDIFHVVALGNHMFSVKSFKLFRASHNAHCVGASFQLTFSYNGKVAAKARSCCLLCILNFVNN